MKRTLRIGPTQTLDVLRSDDEVFEVEATYAPGGSAPPAHFHPNHDEVFVVLEGTLHAAVDGRELDLATGERLDVTRGQVHAFWNVSDAPARVHWTSTPPMQADSWFTGLAALVAEAIESGRNQLDPDAMGRHLAAHADTYRPA